MSAIRTQPARLDHVQNSHTALSVSLGIVRSHGGTIDIESKPGIGTTIRIRLPLG